MPSNTKLRKKPKPLTKESKMELISDYSDGLLTIEEIAKKFNTTENNVSLIVSRHWDSLTNMRESRALLSSHQSGTPTKDASRCLSKIKNTSQINKDFLGLLSEDSAPTLSEPESIYAWIYVHSGDSEMALQEAGLDVGLIKAGKRTNMTLSYDKALMIRSLYLNSKPNVADYIKDVRERKYIDQDINKARVQLELKDQLEQLKTSPGANRKEILRTIELLGKTVGAFVERVEVSEIDPSKALDRLIELAKEAEVTEVTASEEIIL